MPIWFISFIIVLGSMLGSIKLSPLLQLAVTGVIALISIKKLINPKILGGFIVSKIDGTIFDASLLGRLNQLKRGMVK